MKNLCISIVYATALAVLSPTTATAGSIDCYGCTDQEIEALATSNIYHMQINGPLYIYDLKSGSVKKYVFFSDQTPETNPEFDPINHWAAPVPVEPEVAALIQGFYELTLELQATVPSYVSQSAKSDELPSDAFEAIERLILKQT